MPRRAALIPLLAGLALRAAAAAPAPAPPAPQDIQHQTAAVNIEVPVRVFRGQGFVDGLTRDDFEVFEDGRPQRIEAFYLVKKTIIERRDESRDFAPRTARHFFLFFELGEYDARVLEALDYFVRTVLLPGDNLTLVTPMKTYRMKGELFGLVGRDRTYDQITGLLRRDIEIGYSESRRILGEMADLARIMASDVRNVDVRQEAADLALVNPVMTLPVDSPYQAATLEEQLMHYATLLERLGSLRVVDQAKLMGFAGHLKAIEGQKGVFFFYQRETVPKLDPRLVDRLSAQYSQRPEITQSLETIFNIEKRDITVDVDRVAKAYADASASIHFLHITQAAAGPAPAEVRLEEQSEDVFGPFREMARATGGYADATANIAAAMKAAVAASENYYLLYYTPDAYKADGRFRTITVRVKAGGGRVLHRLGYVAD